MLIKSLFCIFALFFLFGFSAFAADEPIVSARAAVLMVAKTGEVIFEKNSSEQLSMASTTKIMSAVLALENEEPEKAFTVNPELLKVEGTSMGLIAGDKVSMRALVAGMLLASGNDAANVTANAIGGSVDGFVKMMNNKAKAIGMKNTCFVTPSGLDSKEHLSTAYDMALLGSYAILLPEFRAICSQRSMMLAYGNPPYNRWLSNHNRLLREYEGAIGIKTGFTKKSGRCLVSAAERGGVVLVCVTLNAPSDWSDHRRLLDYGFERVNPQILDYDLSGINIKVFGTGSTIGVKCFEEPSANTASGLSNVKVVVSLPQYVYAPVSEGEIIGEVRFVLADKTIFSTALCADKSVKFIGEERKEAPKKGFFEKLKQLFTDWIKI